MGIEFNHTIVHARDKKASANFLAEILGLRTPKPFGHFLMVETSNHVTLDFIETDKEFEMQHYAFRVSEKEFEEIFERIKNRGLTYWATPAKSKPGEIYSYNNGKGVYFEDPSGHLMEILTWNHTN